MNTDPTPEARPASQGYDAAAPPAREKACPRTGPIVWGALFLVFCAFVVQRELAPGAVEPAVWIAVTVIGLGVLLLAVGIAVVLRGRGSQR